MARRTGVKPSAPAGRPASLNGAKSPGPASFAPPPRGGAAPRRPARTPWILHWFVLGPLMFLLATGSAFGYMWWTTPVTDELTGATQSHGDQVHKFVAQVTHPEQPLSAAFGGYNEISVLMLGLDHVPSSRRDPDPLRRGDSELLAKVDFTTKQVRIVSIPRDGWVEELNSRGDVVHDKLAHAYAHGQERYKGDPSGGIRNSIDAVRRLTGVEANYFVVIQFDGLAKLVDALGGLDVDVEKRMKYTDRAGGLFINFQPGPQHMTGEQVVQYARFRHDAVGDIGRMARQQKVIKLIMEEVKKPQNLPRLPQFAQILQEAVMTNFTPEQLLAFVQHIKDFDKEGVQSTTLMSYGNQEKGHEHDAVGAPRGMSVQVIYPADVAEAKAFLEDLAVPPPPPVPGSPEALALEQAKAEKAKAGKPDKSGKAAEPAPDDKSGDDAADQADTQRTVDGNGDVIGGDDDSSGNDTYVGDDAPDKR